MSLSYYSKEAADTASLNELITQHLEAFATELPLKEGEKIAYVLPSTLFFIKQSYKKDLKLIGIILFCLWPILFVGLLYIMINPNIAIYLGIAVGLALTFCFSLYYFIYRWLWTRDIEHYQGTFFIYTNLRLIVKGYNPISRMPNSLYAYQYQGCKDFKLAAQGVHAALTFINKTYMDLNKQQSYVHEEGFNVTVPVDMHAKAIVTLMQNKL